jgi:broad specificity phosphatase PhoE
MSKILLARHGNTFGPGDKVVWVGANEDYPLVEKGEQQAADLGNAINASGVDVSRIICGPLVRTWRAADIVADIIGHMASVEIDHRLKEIDYGSWGGKSCDEIIAEFGKEAHTQWNEHHQRPTVCDWKPNETAIKCNALDAMTHAAKGEGLALIITSNGVLRYMYNELTGPDAEVKVKTGNMCAVDMNGEDGTRLFWNEKPDAELLGKVLG